MRSFFASILVFMWGSGTVALAAEPATRWSVIIYSAIDEEEIASFTDPAVKQLLEMALPSDVELLIQNDTYSPNGVTRSIRRPGQSLLTENLGEHDSASRESVTAFAQWAQQEARGVHRLFIVMTHAWGWKGIIQDYTVPGAPDEDTMLPLREFASAIADGGLQTDVLLLDSCVLGNAEALSEFAELAPWIVASQKETPFGGFPYPALFGLLAAPQLSPRDVAQRIPEQYVSAYTRAGTGSMVGGENPYEVVTATAVDSRKWRIFENRFKRLVNLIGKAGGRQVLEAEPSWLGLIADEDANVDLVELLSRIDSWVKSPALHSGVRILLDEIAYPVADGTAGMNPIAVPASDKVEIRIAMGPLRASPEKLKELKKLWVQANQDLSLPRGMSIKFAEVSGSLHLVVRYSSAKAHWIRPWLPGVLRAEVATLDEAGHWQREVHGRRQDFVSVPSFADSSFMLSEAHTFGAPFIHGIGVNFKPAMDDKEERAEDPINGLLGPGLYRSMQWNQRTGWGDLILLNSSSR